MLCWNKYFQFWMFSRSQYPHILTCLWTHTVAEWRRAELHISKSTFALKRGRGQSLYTEKEWCHAVAKPFQWQWIPAACSVLMSDDNIWAIRYLMAPGSPDLTVRDFFLWGYLKELLCRNRSHKCRSWCMIFGVKLWIWIKNWCAEFLRVLSIVLR